MLSILLVCAVAITIANTEAATPANDKNSSLVNGGYIVKPVKSSSGNIDPMIVYDSITQGQTNWHGKVVSSYMTSLNVDLNWGNSANSLQLTIYSPDGHVFGPYYDADDGVIDGQINIDIDNPNGIAEGTWYAEVYGYHVTGTQSYSI